MTACEFEEPRLDDSELQGADASSPGIEATDEEHIRCGDLICKAPALCVASVQATRCRCPLGYIDVRGDGSDCRDINECVLPGICDRNGKCTNTPGSFECECAAPALTLLGNICVCADGYTRSSAGECLAEDGIACETDQGCLNHHCEGGTCCAVHCDRPSECHTSEAASCSDGKTCSYPAVADGTLCDDAQACTIGSVCDEGKCTGGTALDCDDQNPCTDDSCDEALGCRNFNNESECDDENPCTTNDACSVGLCGGENKRCEADANSCTSSSCDPESGECGASPLPDGTRCDDASSCTQGETCAAGSCSAELTTCGPHAMACSSAEPQNQCTCAAGFVDNTRGRCVPENDECAAQSVCAPDAECDDPSSNAGDVVCKCKPGFSGDGRSCSAQDACSGNPCGDDRGTCTSSAPGTHSCVCAPGFVEIAGSCVCDMTGTFAVRSRSEIAWSGGELLEAGHDSAYGYAIERFSYDADGELVLEHLPCGDGPLDMCGVGSAPTIAPEAYAPYIPANVWDSPGIPKVQARVHPAAFIPGAPFRSDILAHLHGIALEDPLGAWPTTHREVAGTPGFTGSAVNGARWLDQDSDGFVGLTSYLVPPGGVTNAMIEAVPPRAYGANSPVCPRNGGPHTPYAYLPAPAEGNTNMPVRVKRFFSAFRMLAAYRGSLNSCDEITGDVHGKSGDQIRVDIRVGGCIRTHQDGETACNDAAIESLDRAVRVDATANATFVMKRWPGDTPVSCAEARAITYE